MNKSNQIKPLTARHRIGYALGDFGGCMTFGLMTAFTTYLMYEAVYAIHVIAFAGLISGMAVNDDERSKLSAARGISGTLGGILPQVLFPRIIEFFEKDPQLGYGVGVTVCAAIGLVLCMGCCALTEERNAASRSVNAAPIRVSDIAVVLTKNRAVLALCIHGMLQGVLMSVSGSERLLRGSLLIGAALYVGLFAAHALTTVNVWVHIGWNAVASGFANLSNMMQWGMLGESIEYNEFLTGKRTEGSINGTFNMLRRLGQGVGAATGVAILGMIGYDAAAAVQSAGTILGIKALSLLFPALCALGSWLVFRFVWNITPELREKMAMARQA